MVTPSSLREEPKWRMLKAELYFFMTKELTKTNIAEFVEYRKRVIAALECVEFLPPKTVFFVIDGANTMPKCGMVCLECASQDKSDIKKSDRE